MSGVQWQPLSAIVQPSQLLYLLHFSPPCREIVDFLLSALSRAFIDDVLFLRDCVKAAGLIIRQLNVTISKKWVKETMLLKASEPLLENLDGLLLHLADHPEDATHLLYHLCLRTLRTVPVAAPRVTTTRYGTLKPYLLLFAEECSFAITSDTLLHCIVYCHLPAEVGMAESTPFQHITAIMGDRANKHIRPFIDTSIADQMKARDEDEDDIVLFCLLVTLIVEIEKKTELQLCYNRNVLRALQPSSVPTPFVLVDLDIGHGASDYYGYTYKGSLVVCNGLGCGQAISEWLSVCTEATYCREILLANMSTDNPLFKFATSV